MYHRAIILLSALFLLTNCQKERLDVNPPSTGNDMVVDARQNFPELIPLPNGFAPEGIVAGDGNDFYVGSLASGAIYKGDFRTGSGEVIYNSGTEPAVGLAFDKRTKYLYIAGGPKGEATIINTRNGAEVAVYELGPGFINDVIVTKDAAYFTNSFASEFYKVALRPSGTPTDAVSTISLGGDFPAPTGGFDANGIEAIPDGSALIIVNSSAGALYYVDPASGDATLIDLNGGNVSNGDGILLQGKTLYIVQNFQNQIAEVHLSSDYLSGTVGEPLTDLYFDIPTTVTRKGGTLYAVNARFGTPVTPDTEYDVVKVDE